MIDLPFTLDQLRILKAIASNVKDWAGNWDAVWDNIMLRASIKKTIVEVSNKLIVSPKSLGLVNSC